MAVISMPAALKVGDFTLGQRRYDLAMVSDATGAEQARLFGPPRWVCSMQAPRALTRADAVVWQTMLLQLRGRINHLAVWDRSSPYPQGTVRGTLVLNASMSAGATSATINGGVGQAGTTVAVGDKFQIGTGVGTSQLVYATSAATLNGSGVGTFTFEPPARIAFSSSTAVAWDRPVAYFKAQADESSWQAVAPEVFGGFGIDLLESFS